MSAGNNATPWMRWLVTPLSALMLTGALVGASHAAEATQASAASAAPAAPAGGRVEGGSGTRPQLPATGGTTIRLKDGSTIWRIDPAVIKAARARTLANGYPKCGPQCDGKDPASYRVTNYVAGIGVISYSCDDAISIYTHLPPGYPGDPWAELRWSAKCETSWVRGCCYTNYRIHGYFSRGGNLRTHATAYGRNLGYRIYSAMLDNSYPLVANACFDGQIGGTPSWNCGPQW